MYSDLSARNRARKAPNRERKGDETVENRNGQVEKGRRLV